MSTKLLTELSDKGMYESCSLAEAVLIIFHRSGLHAGDIITHINDVPISVASDIYSTCNSLDDKKYTINLLRKGVKKKITLTK